MHCTQDWDYVWKGNHKGQNVTEYISKDTPTYSGIPAHTSDEMPKFSACSVMGEVKEMNEVTSMCIQRELIWTSKHHTEDM